MLVGLIALLAMYVFISALWAMTGMPTEAAMVLGGISMIALFALVGKDEKGKQGQRKFGSASNYATMDEKQRRKEDDEQFDVLFTTWIMDEEDR
jgi:hypothetical protein